MLENIENKVIRKYGFENHITITVFKITELLRKLGVKWNDWKK